MKTKFKSNKGITLVALIITIIVLLILAMVSIRLVMNGGIIDKSKSAVDKYSEEEIQEQIKLAYAEWQTARWTNDAGDAATFMQTRLRTALKDDSLTVTETDGVFKVTLSNGKRYEYNATTGVASEGLPDGKVKYGDQILGVGDQVNYDPTLEATGETTYTSLATTSGAGSDQAFDAATYKNAGFKWRVLDVKGGKIRLIADTDIGPGDYSENKTYYQLQGQKGYINGISELNAISGIFGKGKGAESATSVTVDDINGITGYNPNSPKFNQGEWSEYGNKITYTYNSENNYTSTRTNGATAEDNKYNDINYTFHYYDSSTRTFKELTSGSTQITSTYYYKNYNDDVTKSGVLNSDGTFSAPYELLFGKYMYDASNNYDRSFKGTREHSYWLASEYVGAYYNDAYWGLRSVGGAGVYYYRLYDSYGYESGSNYGVRPVVSLKSNVNIQWNATANEWQIQ